MSAARRTLLTTPKLIVMNYRSAKIWCRLTHPAFGATSADPIAQRSGTPLGTRSGRADRRIGGVNPENAITRSPVPTSGLAEGRIDPHLASRRPKDDLAKARSTGIHGDRATLVFKPGVQPLGITGEAQSDDRD